MENKIVNWGVISCARIADIAVIPGIKAASNAKLYAISSRSKEKLEEYSQKHKPVKAYQSYNDLLDDPDIDAVYIPLPNSLPVSYTHLTLPTNREVKISVVAV